ncbi:MAG: 3' terminal RNA ribose 2'-O-methyltransferase Hen1 [Stappiaceae bacterium]
MQIELTLNAPPDESYSASDLGFLLHKHPAHLHHRDTGAGSAHIFYRSLSDTQTTAVLFLEVDPIALVRGKSQQSDGLLSQYVNDRPYAANSLLSVAISRCFGQSLAGKSKERQSLADRPLPFEVRIEPIALSGDPDFMASLFEPLGYELNFEQLAGNETRGLYRLSLQATQLLRHVLGHLYVLIPVLDNAKHYFVGEAEVENLLEKGAEWLPGHPAKEVITRRALKHRRALANQALARLSETDGQENENENRPQALSPEAALEKPIRLHDVRLDQVADVLLEQNAVSVLDLGCGEGRLIGRLLKMPQITRIVGVDPAISALKRAQDRLHPDRMAEGQRKRLTLQLGSLTYGDRRFQGFDAAVLVEVIEHVDPERLPSLALSLFGDARPRCAVITTPNREYNALFEGMDAGALRHPDHRFEWTREEFNTWSHLQADEFGYEVELRGLGPEDERYGAPSQMAVFKMKDTSSNV